MMTDVKQATEQDAIQLLDEPPIDSQWAQSMQETILSLQQEIQSLKMKLAEEQIARRDQILMENLRTIRERKNQRNLWQQIFGAK